MIKKRILFVDDEANILAGIRRMLRPLRKELEFEFAESGSEALKILTEATFDVVVSDMRMPGMDGAELLTEVRRLYPDTMRIMLSGYSAPEAVMRTVTVVHQFLSKPCEPESLKDTLLRACQLRDILTDPKLRGLVASIDKLPSLPAIYAKLQEILAREDCSVDEVAKCISQDIGMSAKILQLVNSPFFGLFRTVESPAQAVSLLGLDTVKYLVLSVKIFSEFEKEHIPVVSLVDLWDHSMVVGAYAKRIAEHERCDAKTVNDAFLSGLMHDVGKLVLVSNMPGKYKEALKLADDEAFPMEEAEQKIFHADHCRIGAYLLGLWGFSVGVLEAIAFHHSPEDFVSTSFNPGTAVHVANAIDHEQTKRKHGGSLPEVHLEYLERVQCRERLEDWRKLCQVVSS